MEPLSQLLKAAIAYIPQLCTKLQSEPITDNSTTTSTLGPETVTVTVGDNSELYNNFQTTTAIENKSNVVMSIN